MSLEGTHENNARKLYNQFRRQLEADEKDIFYDEDDLVQIYDLAVDLEDEYIKLQTLLLAYRLYPNSEEMAVRRGYFFWSYNMDDGVNQLLKSSLASDRLLWKLLALRNHSLSEEELKKQLTDLLASTNEIDDETIIQLINLVAEAELYDWLKENEALLRAKTTYLPTLLYELYAGVYMPDDKDYAISKLEELTELEPFNVDYWTMLSEEQINAGNISAALSAADYALAIDSENEAAILARARAMSCEENPDAEAILKLLNPVLKSNSNNIWTYKIAATALLQLNRIQDALKIMEDFHNRNPWSKEAIDYLLTLRYPKIEEALHKFHEASSDNSETTWANWAKQKYREKKYKEAALIFRCYRQNHLDMSEENLDLYMSALYIGGFYQICVKEYIEAISDYTETGFLNQTVSLMGLLSMLRSNEYPMALKTLDFLMKLDPAPAQEDDSFNAIMKQRGFKSILKEIKSVMKPDLIPGSEAYISAINSFDSLYGLSDPTIDY